MTTKIKSSTTLRTAVACLAVFGASQTMAQTLTGTVTDRVGNGGYLANISFATGSTIFGATGVIACIELGALFPELPSLHTYDVAPITSVVDVPAAAAKTEALMNWVVDTYYERVLSWNIGGEAFNRVLWELSEDYDGTLASLSISSGEMQGSPSGQYASMLSELRSAYSSISTSYRSDSFTVRYLVDRNQTYQNMALITAVPEPSTYLMMFAGVGALMAWRRRSAR